MLASYTSMSPPSVPRVDRYLTCNGRVDPSRAATGYCWLLRFEVVVVLLAGVRVFCIWLIVVMVGRRILLDGIGPLLLL